jgi:amino acid permease
MISIGGVIGKFINPIHENTQVFVEVPSFTMTCILKTGTGLFLGTASALHNAGPAGMVLGYIVMGSGA